MLLSTIQFNPGFQDAQEKFFSKAFRHDFDFIERLNQTPPLALKSLDFKEFAQIFNIRENEYAGLFDINSEEYHALFKALRRLIHVNPSLNIQSTCRSKAFKIEFQDLQPIQSRKPFIDLSVFTPAPKIQDAEIQTDNRTSSEFNLKSFGIGVLCCLTLISVYTLNIWAIAACFLISAATICHTYEQEIRESFARCYD